MRNPSPLLLLLPLSAWGSTVLGNPNAIVESIQGDDIYVDTLEGKWCAGSGHTLTLQKTIDEGQHFGVTLQETDYCLLVLSLRWTPSSPLEEVEVTGFDILDISASADEFVIELDATNETATLTVP
ncbi:MAG: hypothetical protein H6737_06940 [Alphaproteobacteria bacterium]|nr:hypothetical protein [Alphaproteobacteria bacterium]